jgi:Cu+-exporting ATPase
MNIDVPIALGISVLFLRSAYDVITQSGPGYFDSLTGLVFFLFLGKFFQRKTYESLSFDRDYKSYFPVAVTRLGEVEGIFR